MNNIKPFMKRVCAYAIDTAIVLFLVSVVSLLPFVNKYMEGYRETYQKYVNDYNKYADYLKKIEEAYEDKEITAEEYNTIIELETYNEILTAKYDDTNITEEEYDEIVKEINADFDPVINNYAYLLNKEAAANTIVTLVCTLLYFGVFQYLLNGQTLGKRILKIKIVSANNKKLSVFNYMLRSLVVNDVFLKIISVSFLIFASKKVYTNANYVVEVLISVVEALIVFLVISREDKRGLHDLLFNTKVINVEEKEELKKEEKNKIIDAEYQETTKEKKTTKSKESKTTKTAKKQSAKTQK